MHRKIRLKRINLCFVPEAGTMMSAHGNAGCDSRCSASCYYGNSVSNHKLFHRASVSCGQSEKLLLEGWLV